MAENGAKIGERKRKKHGFTRFFIRSTICAVVLAWAVSLCCNAAFAKKFAQELGIGAKSDTGYGARTTYGDRWTCRY